MPSLLAFDLRPKALYLRIYLSDSQDLPVLWFSLDKNCMDGLLALVLIKRKDLDGKLWFLDTRTVIMWGQQGLGKARVV